MNPTDRLENFTTPTPTAVACGGLSSTRGDRVNSSASDSRLQQRLTAGYRSICRRRSPPVSSVDAFGDGSGDRVLMHPLSTLRVVWSLVVDPLLSDTSISHFP